MLLSFWLCWLTNKSGLNREQYVRKTGGTCSESSSIGLCCEHSGGGFSPVMRSIRTSWSLQDQKKRFFSLSFAFVTTLLVLVPALRAFLSTAPSSSVRFLTALSLRLLATVSLPLWFLSALLLICIRGSLWGLALLALLGGLRVLVLLLAPRGDLALRCLFLHFHWWCFLLIILIVFIIVLNQRVASYSKVS